MHKLDGLRAERVTVGSAFLSKEDGEAAIRAVRRGVSQVEAGRVLGLSYNGLKHALGAWALQHATVPDAPEGE